MPGQDKLSLMRDDCQHDAEVDNRRRERNNWLQDNHNKRGVIKRIGKHLDQWGVDWPWQDIIEIIEEIPDLDNELTKEFEGSE